MGKVVGIDLGTTNSVIAIVDRDTPRVIESADGTSRLTPSVVTLDGGERLVGAQAKGMAKQNAVNTVYSVKRFMGRKFADEDVQRDVALMPYSVQAASNGDCAIVIKGQAYSPAEISAFILEAMKKDAEETLGGEVTHAVITVPAYFGQRQKEATRHAGKLAGLKVMRILEEPTAAALAYGLTTQTSEPRSILIYDLGGGTFDVTVMLASGGVFVDLAKQGNNHLGGDDFDEKIINHALTVTGRRSGVDLRGNAEALQLLKDAAETAKIALSRRERVVIKVPAIPHGERGQFVDVELELTRKQYEEMIRPEVARTIELVHRAIREASYTTDDIDHIVLVGGSTATPLVVESLRAEFGDAKILRSINPMEAVALGAAIQSAIISPDDAVDDDDWPTLACGKCGYLNPAGRPDCRNCAGGTAFGGAAGQTLMVSTAKVIGMQTLGDIMEPMIPARTYYPMKEPVQRYFKTTVPGQRLVRVPVYEGDDPVASKNEYLGEASGDLPEGLAEGTEVAVSFSLDSDGIITVSARVPTAPQVKVEALIDLAQQRGASVSMPGTPGAEMDWRQKADTQCGFKSAMVNLSSRYIEDQHRKRLDRLDQEVKQARGRGDQERTIARTDELEKANQENPVAFWVFVKEALSRHPATTSTEQRELHELHVKLDRALANNSIPQAGEALQGIQTIATVIIGRLGSGGLLEGLLRA